jgi:hypothetical protein
LESKEKPRYWVAHARILRPLYRALSIGVTSTPIDHSFAAEPGA